MYREVYILFPGLEFPVFIGLVLCVLIIGFIELRRWKKKQNKKD